MTRALHKTRLEADSTTASDVPASADLPAGYVDGAYRTVDALRRRFSHKRIVTITVNGSTPGADVIDREAGDASARTAARYVHDGRVAGHWPTIYFPLSDIAEICHELKAIGLGPDVPLWTAHYTGVEHICGKTCLKPYGPLPFTPLIVATQYADPKTSGGHFDLSQVADYWPGVDPKPAPKPGRRPRGFGGPMRAALHLVIFHGGHRRDPLKPTADALAAKAIAALERLRSLKGTP
ncbi:MAG: hypothetical protein JO222_09110 [Frankiales bacterium]|nr:hypothetical protein [Frankiales bacterium]